MLYSAFDPFCEPISWGSYYASKDIPWDSFCKDFQWKISNATDFAETSNGQFLRNSLQTDFQRKNFKDIENKVSFKGSENGQDF